MSTLKKVDLLRISAGTQFSRAQKANLGQFFTPAPICQFMASLFSDIMDDIKLLDPGCGVGSLFSAFLDEALSRGGLSSINITAYEIDNSVKLFLKDTLAECYSYCNKNNIKFMQNIVFDDFITSTALSFPKSLLENCQKFTHVIMNPPYKKISNSSLHKKILSSKGIEVVNLYAAFMVLAIKLLKDGGEIVAIIPRSFCNGTYYQPFRTFLLKEVAIKRIHIFDSRNNAFANDKVLQENIIIHCVKGAEKQAEVLLTSSPQSYFYKDVKTGEVTTQDMTIRRVKFNSIVKLNDLHQFIYIVPSEREQHISDRLSCFNSNLDDIGIKVSTGPIVDFRLKEDLRIMPEVNTAPLLYPCHLNGSVVWPKESKKPNAIKITGKSKAWLWKNVGHYVLTRRFSSKEEKKRIIATYYDSSIPGDLIGFDNKLNVFHINREGMLKDLAKGLYVYLNCSLLDQYYRQFGGHTQVNATDLRSLKYPPREVLERMGKKITEEIPSQEKIDIIVNKEIGCMPSKIKSSDPLKAQLKIDQALEIVTLLGMPKAQQNERSALTFLALLNLHPYKSWKDIERPMIGVTPIMDWCRDVYGKEYAPNTRETFRKQTLHQFVCAGIVLYNPDKPNRAVNSPKVCYQITPELHSLLLAYGSDSWDRKLKKYLKKQTTLVKQYAREREMNMIPLNITDNIEIKLTPGSHSKLIRDIIIEFGPRFIPGAEVIYIGDTGSKEKFFLEDRLTKFGVDIDHHGKMPDVILYCHTKNWLVVIESVTSHGPVDNKRHDELNNLFANAKPELIFVTAFPNRKTMAKYLSKISWETEVWTADAPTHMIHFNGDKFLGPHK